MTHLPHDTVDTFSCLPNEALDFHKAVSKYKKIGRGQWCKCKGHCDIVLSWEIQNAVLLFSMKTLCHSHVCSSLFFLNPYTVPCISFHPLGCFTLLLLL